MKRFWKILWYMRCVVAWTFRIAAISAGIILMIGISVFAFNDPVNFNKLAPPPLGGVGLGLAAFGVMALLELTGRLLSWTNPLDDLPRFKDYYWIERWRKP